MSDQKPGAAQQGAAAAQAVGSKMSQLVRKYGKVAIGVHLSVYAVFLAGEVLPGRGRGALVTSLSRAWGRRVRRM